MAYEPCRKAEPLFRANIAVTDCLLGTPQLTARLSSCRDSADEGAPMSILIFAVIVLIVAALIVWAVQKLPLPAPFGTIIQAVILVIAAIVIAKRAGLF